ncbi:MAG: hypothetical protein ACREIA_25000 [Opitutaceae bacterium]
MIATITALLRDPVPYRGLIGLLTTLTLENLNTVMGLLVGLATFAYLCVRIRHEVTRKRENDQPRPSTPSSPHSPSTTARRSPRDGSQ